MPTEDPEAVRCALVAVLASVDDDAVRAAVALLEEVAARGGPAAVTYWQAVEVLRKLG